MCEVRLYVYTLSSSPPHPVEADSQQKLVSPPPHTSLTLVSPAQPPVNTTHLINSSSCLGSLYVMKASQTATLGASLDSIAVSFFEKYDWSIWQIQLVKRKYPNNCTLMLIRGALSLGITINCQVLLTMFRSPAIFCLIPLAPFWIRGLLSTPLCCSDLFALMANSITNKKKLVQIRPNPPNTWTLFRGRHRHACGNYFNGGLLHCPLCVKGEPVLKVKVCESVWMLTLFAAKVFPILSLQYFCLLKRSKGRVANSLTRVLQPFPTKMLLSPNLAIYLSTKRASIDWQITEHPSQEDRPLYITV